MPTEVAAPPLSLGGVREALRWPTRQDLLFSLKGVLAAALSLWVGFSENLDNPYWSALTVYVLLSQPQTGAIRSKSLYRFAGTLAGGFSAIVLAALFGDSVGWFLFSLLGLVVATLYFKLLDRTPASYFWFATSLTAAIIGIVHVQQPGDVFPYAVTRMVEISLGVLAVLVADSLLGPRPQTEDFLTALRAWRDEAGEWVAAALAPNASDLPHARLERRRALRRISARTAVLDAQGVQLPFDAVRRPLPGRDLRFLRLVLARLTAELIAANIWAEASRGADGENGDIGEAVGRARAWLAGRPPLADEAIARHAREGAALARDLRHDAEAMFAGYAPVATLRGATLVRLAELVETWTTQDAILHAMSTGEPLPATLRPAARRARPARSIDYLASALDIMPLVLSFAGGALVWYLTAWTAGQSALLFAFVIASFVLGAPGAVASAIGEVVWIGISFALAFVYQFAILPQVTAFPVLIAVVAVVMIPAGVFTSMSMAGVLVTSNTFAFLGLQNTYAGDFQSSLETLVGSLAGCFMTLAAVYVCGYDAPRLRARRLARALAQDVAQASGARRTADADRYTSLAMDRLSLFYTAQAALPAGDPLRGLNMVGRFRVGASTLALRDAERGLGPLTAARCRTLRLDIARAFRRRDPGEHRATLLRQTETASAVVAADAVSPARQHALDALTGLRIAFRPDEAFEALLHEAGA